VSGQQNDIEDKKEKKGVCCMTVGKYIFFHKSPARDLNPALFYTERTTADRRCGLQ
jgi:hypothetical protein